MRTRLCVLLTLTVSFHCALSLPAPGADKPYARTFPARDTFINPTDASAVAQRTLDELAWKPAAFKVACTAVPATGPDAEEAAVAGYDALVRFPSPYSSDNGNDVNDTVVMEWFAARDKAGKPIDAPAMLVLHILQGKMVVARAFARGFRNAGIHAFVMHMPHYGRRRAKGLKVDAKLMLESVRQAVADGRRARDAIAALPHVRKDHIGIQGTSLGGFICAATASADDVFNPVLITLAGGDLKRLFRDGLNEIRDIRKHLIKLGVSEEQFDAMLEKIEPLNLAHRLNPMHTWMFNAQQDVVVPPANARALAKAAKLPKSHHIWLPGGHVTSGVHLPQIVKMMVEQIKVASVPKPALNQ